MPLLLGATQKFHTNVKATDRCAFSLPAKAGSGLSGD